MIAHHTPLTDHQAKVLRYLETQRDATGLMPSTREVQAHFRFASQSQAMSVLRALEKKGAIERLPKKARGLVLAKRPGQRRFGCVVDPDPGNDPRGASPSMRPRTSSAIWKSTRVCSARRRKR